MALVQLSDVIEPEVYTDFESEDSPEKSALFESGIVVRNPMLDQKASTGGKTLDIPFWKDLDASAEPNYSDSSENNGTPNKIVAGEQIARIAYLNQGYKAADLVSEVAGSDPMQRVRNRFGTYWMRQWQRRLIASANGILADNVANDSSDMVNDIASETGLSAGASNLYSRSAFVETAFSMGDRYDNISAIGVHSVILKAMIKADDIDYMPDSQGSMTIPTYMGKIVIVDDTLPVVAGSTNGFKYTSVLYGDGAFGFGEGESKVPVELERSPSQGLGGGVETLWERKTWLLHPFGTQFLSDTVTGESPNLANLALAANWDRVVDRKNMPLAFLITNG